MVLSKVRKVQSLIIIYDYQNSNSFEDNHDNDVALYDHNDGSANECKVMNHYEIASSKCADDNNEVINK